jgi:hypothetical protein
MIVPG